MNSYALSVLIAIMAAAGTLAVVPTYASSFSEEACPDCGSDDIYLKANMAQDIPVTVSTDKTIYDHSSEIVITGTVANLRGGEPITITVHGPQNNLVTVRQVDVSADKTYETAFVTSGALFKQNGMYTIRAQYGPQGIYDKVVVELVGAPGVAGGTACDAGEIAVKGGNKTYCVPFDAFGAVVTKASVSSETKSMIIGIASESDGSLTLQIPNSVLRSESSSGNTDFIILVDDEEADFVEIDSDDTSRTVEIFFPEGATQIEIIGTWAVPEFGTVAAIILAVAIISIIAVSARNRLSIFPRY